MSETINRVKTSIWEWRVAILWFLLFSVNSLCSAMLASLMHVKWATLDGQDKFLAVVLITWNWTTTIMAFVSKQAARIKQTGDVFPTSDTTYITKPGSQQDPQPKKDE